ncbi:MAG: hypothetical protein RMH97_00815 [Verrucomicrobiales bacterium]|nr:hypothetical protein [Verrucomicrobiales bacterium]
MTAAITITNDVVIYPGESIVLVETTAARPMDPARFRSWWGTNNVPSRVKIVYAGSGIGLSSSGDGLYLWNAAATANTDFICGVTFGPAPTLPRRTFVYNVDSPGRQTPTPGSLTLVSSNAINGAWIASNGDIGSPGRVIAPIEVQIFAAAGGAALRWPTVPGRSYVLEARTGVGSDGWTVLTNFAAADDYALITQPFDLPARFFRVGTTLLFPAP